MTPSSRAQTYYAELSSQAETLKRRVTELRNAAQHEMILDDSFEPHETVVAYISSLEDEMHDLTATQAEITRIQLFLGLPSEPMEELTETADEISLKKMLWLGHESLQALCHEWAGTHFGAIQIGLMDERLQEKHKACSQLERSMPPNPKVLKFRRLVDEHREILPILSALANPTLKDYHWANLSSIVGVPLSGPDSDNLTLAHLFKLQLSACRDQLIQTSFEATQEAGLEDMLAQLNARWAELELSVAPFKDSAILCNLDVVTEALDDSMMTLATIQASRYVSSIASDVDRTARSLAQFSETLEEWTAVQKTWMYLESIFSAPDIQVRDLSGPACRPVSCVAPAYNGQWAPL